MRVLVVDDEPAVRSAVTRALTLDGYEVVAAEDGPAALGAIQRERPELVVLDVLMPELDGVAVCRRLRGDGDRTPILMLTARDAVSDPRRGARRGRRRLPRQAVRARGAACPRPALLRRTVNGDPHGVLRFADLSLDPATREVRRGEREVELTRTEFLLLELFLLNPRQVLPRALIFDRVWGYDFGPTSNSLEVYVGYLRRKLEAGGEPRLLHTVRGVGYALREAG